MTEMGVPCGPINAINETFAEPQVEHLGMKRSVNHSDIGNFDIVRQPINMTAAKHPNSLEPAPNPGQHTDDVLRALNYDDATIKALRKRGIV
jgi:crotonobetainyl-CoA:carnitine CoA-transferase CaiB-like acyl-CoA transferase